MDLDTQFAQATLNLLRHVAMSAPIPVIQTLKDQLEKRYGELVEPLHPGVDFLVRASLEGEFEAVMPLVGGMLAVAGGPPSVQAIEQNFAASPPTVELKRPPQASISQFKGAGRAYRDVFNNS